jgi:hypothetical protein
VFHSDHRGFSGGTAFVLDFEAIEQLVNVSGIVTAIRFGNLEIDG